MNNPDQPDRKPDAWVQELARFTGAEMKVIHRSGAAAFLTGNRQAVMARALRLLADLPPALHFDPRTGGKDD